MHDTILPAIRPVTRLSRADIAWAGDLLTLAFQGEPFVSGCFGPTASNDAMAYFFRCNVRYALRHGEAYGDSTRNVIALWLPPAHSRVHVMSMMLAGMWWSPLFCGVRATRRLAQFGHDIAAHKQDAIQTPHYYLLMAGVSPETQASGHGRALLQCMLERFDHENMPAYLETQSPENIAIYEKLGFQLVSERQLHPGLALTNWAMVRMPLRS